MKKKVLKISVIVIGLLLLLYALLNISPVRRGILHYAVKKLEAATGAVIHADSLDYNLFEWRFTLENLTLSKNHSRDNPIPIFFKAQKVMVDIPFPLSWKKTLHFQEVKILKPEIAYVVSAGGIDNFPFEASRDKSTPGSDFPSFRFENLTIGNTKFIYKDQSNGIHLEIPGIDITADWLEKDNHTLSLDTGGAGKLQLHDQTIPINDLHLRTGLNHRRMELKDLTVQWGENLLKAHGLIKDYLSGNPALDIYTDINLSSAEAGRLLPRLKNTRGEVFITAHLAGPVLKPRIDSQFRFKEFLLSKTLPSAASGNGEIHLLGYNLEHFKGEGNIEFLPLRSAPAASSQTENPLQGRVSFQVRPGKVILKLKGLNILGSRLDGNLNGDGQELQGTLQAEIPALRKSLLSLRQVLQVLPLNGSSGLIEPVLETGIDGQVLLDLQVGGTLSSPRISARFNSSLGLNGQNAIHLQGLASYHKDRVKISTLNCRLKKGNVRISGIVPLSSPHGSDSAPPPVRLDLVGENLDTSEIASTLDIAIPVQAGFSLQSRLEMEPESGRVYADVERLEIKSGDHILNNAEPFRFKLDPSLLSIDNLKIEGIGTDIKVDGNLRLDGIQHTTNRPLTLKARLDCRLARLFFPFLGAEGIMELQGEIKGGLQRPEIEGRLDLSKGIAAIKDFQGVMDNIEIHLRASDKKLAVEPISFDWQGARFSIRGEVPYSTLIRSSEPEPGYLIETGGRGGNERFSLALAVSNVSAQMLKPFLSDQWADKLSGSMTVNLEIHGDRFSPEQLTGKAEIRNFQLSIDGFPFRQQDPITFSMDNGIVLLENLKFSGPESFLQGKGTLILKGEFPLRGQLEGEINSRLLDTLGEDLAFSGTNRLHLKLNGDLSHPRLSGELEIKGGGVQHLIHHLYINGLKGKIIIDGSRIFTEESIEGTFNGGEVKVTLGDKGWDFAFQKAQMDIPWGLLSTASGKLQLIPLTGGKGYRLQGSIPVTNGTYKEAFGLNSRLFRYLRQVTAQPPVQTIDQEETPVEFNINIFTETPIQVENNMVKAEVSAAFSLTGTHIDPALAGRAEIKEGGEIYLGKNTFYIERGTVNLINPYRVEPELDISARTEVSETSITLNISGPAHALSATLTSTPPLPESHIIALLVSGKPVESTSPTTLSKVGNQTLGYLESAISGKLEQAVKQTLGLETVRIDGSLVAAKENPSARLTLGHHLTPNLEVIMSQNLRQSQERTWIVNYNPLEKLNLQGVRMDDNAYTLGINHEIGFGLKNKTPGSIASRKKSRKKSQPRIEEIVIEGDSRLPTGIIKRYLKLKKGAPFEFFKLQQEIKRLKEFYYKRNFLNVEISSRKEENKNRVKVILEIEAGPQVFLDFQGAEVSKKFKKKAKQIWKDNHFKTQRLNAIRRQLYLYFFKRGEALSINTPSSPTRPVIQDVHYKSNTYGKAAVEVETVKETTGMERVIFHIHRGIRFQALKIRFTGNRYYPAAKLLRLLKKAKLKSDVVIEPEKVTRFMEDWYRRQGFLAVNMNSPKIRWNKNRRELEVELVVNAGARFKIGEILFQGNRFIKDADLEKQILPFRTGNFFSIQKVIDAAAALETLYKQKGYYNSRVSVKQQRDKKRNRVNLSFSINETRRKRINEIKFEGNSITEVQTIRRELLFKTGDFMDLKALNKSRKKLYDLGIFRRVNLEVIPGTEIAGETGEQSSVIEVQVSERKPYRLKYGLQFDTEAGVGVAGELLNVNWEGKATLLGTSFRYNRLEQDVRLFSRFPYFLGKRITTELFLFFNRKKETQAADPVRRMGITLQQQLKLGRKSLLSFSYTFERYRADRVVNLGHLTATYTLDTRDSFWNATKGFFISQSFQFAGKPLGSQMEFSRYLGQFNSYGRWAPRLVSATSLHLGLGSSLGQELLPGEKFFAGGSTTVRGFKYNSIGPLNPLSGEALGGEAMFIFKQELRYQLFPVLSTVLFLDIGNVYPVIADFNPLSTREAAGIGIRYNFSGLLLRLDWGFKLDRRPGESLSRVFFSIGQSF